MGLSGIIISYTQKYPPEIHPTRVNKDRYNKKYANYTRNNALNGVKSTIFGEKRVVLHSHAFSDAEGCGFDPRRVHQRGIIRIIC